MKKLVVFTLVLIAVSAKAQLYPFYKHHEWEKDPVQATKVLDKELYYYTKYLLCVEYIYDGYEGTYYKYETEHYKVKLSSDAAIEEFNKVYIPMEDVLRIKKLEARVIKTDDVVKLKPKVEEFYSEDEDERYYYFPVSQLELGDELEIIYTVQKYPEFDGDQFFFQSDIPIYNFDFYFVAPNDAYFQFKAHNGLTEPVLVDTILQKHQWTIHMDSIEAYEPEYFSEYNNTAMKLDASLRGFDNPSDKSYSPYAEFNALLNMVYNVKFTGKDAKAIHKLNEELGIDKIRSKRSQVRKIENFIKTEMVVSSNVGEQTLADIVKTRRSNSIGSILLFMGMCNDADIEFQYGFISDRYDTKLEDDIESMYFLQSYFLFFPEIKEYVAPLDFTSRMGYLSNDWIPNNGYFLKMKQLPEPTTDWEIRPIPSTTKEKNRDSLIIRIDVSEDMTEKDITVERHLTGYRAGKYQIYYYLYSDNKKKEKHEELLNFFNDNSKFKMTEISGVEPEDAFYKPLVIKGKVTELYSPFIEKAGDKTVLRLGRIFGEHVAVKELEKKKTDFVFANPLKRSWTIIVNFPSGVNVTNLESVFQTEDYSAHEGILMSAELKVEGNVLTFITRQEYDSHRYSIDDKEQVLDAFRYYDQLNKINLIIE